MIWVSHLQQQQQSVLMLNVWLMPNLMLFLLYFFKPRQVAKYRLGRDIVSELLAGQELGMLNWSSKVMLDRNRKGTITITATMYLFQGLLKFILKFIFKVK